MNQNNITPPWERKKNEFNEILRQLEIRTSKQLARRLGVHPITAQKYMRGEYRVRELLAVRGLLLAKRIVAGEDANDAVVKYQMGETNEHRTRARRV